jgi:hypothetical protein
MSWRTVLMPERWRRELGKIDELEPPVHVLDEARAFPPAMQVGPSVRSRAVAGVVAFVLFGAAVAFVSRSFGGRSTVADPNASSVVTPTAWTTYADPLGWRMDVPEGWETVVFPEEGSRLGAAFVSGTPVPTGDDPFAVLPPSDGLLLKVWHDAGDQSIGNDSSFPLSASDLERDVVWTLRFRGDGLLFHLMIIRPAGWNDAPPDVTVPSDVTAVIDRMIESISFEPRDVPVATAPVDVLRITCDGQGAHVDASSVAAQADGVHFVVEGGTSPIEFWPLDYPLMTFGASLAPGEERTLPVPVGSMGLSCGSREPTTSIGPGEQAVEVVDPDHHFVPWFPSCPYADLVRLNGDGYARHGTDRVGAVRDAITGIQAGDVLEAAGYSVPMDPDFDEGWVRVTRDGEVIAEGRAILSGGRFSFTGKQCPGSGLGFAANAPFSGA